jgi:hypothetical protein
MFDVKTVVVRPTRSIHRSSIHFLSIAELVFWTIVGSLRSQKTKEEGQPPVRAKVGATLVLYRSQKELS